VSDQITVTSADGTATGVIKVNITGTNDAATVSSQTKAVTEGDLASDLNTNGKLAITDVDSAETVTWTAGDLVGTYGTFTVAADGTWSYAGNDPHNELNVTDTVSDQITVTSADGTATGVIKVNITGTNDAPIATNDIFSVDEGDTITGNVISHEDDNDGIRDSDGGDGNDLSVTQIQINGVVHLVLPGVVTNVPLGDGTLTIDSLGTFSYTQDGSDPTDVSPSFEYTLSDGGAQNSTSTATVTFNVNDLPEAVDDTFSMNEGTTESGNLLKNDDLGAKTTTVTHVDGIELTFAGDGYATLTIIDGVVAVAPDDVGGVAFDGATDMVSCVSMKTGSLPMKI
jgi:VCBS repeat-containing protein